MLAYFACYGTANNRHGPGPTAATTTTASLASTVTPQDEEAVVLEDVGIDHRWRHRSLGGCFRIDRKADTYSQGNGYDDGNPQGNGYGDGHAQCDGHVWCNLLNHGGE